MYLVLNFGISWLGLVVEAYSGTKIYRGVGIARFIDVLRNSVPAWKEIMAENWNFVEIWLV